MFKNKIRIITATALFDGHDASINMMRRKMQEKGAEVIHLGHNRSVQEILEAVIEEDVQGVAITSYQGGHIEFFTYLHQLLLSNGYGHVKIFGGGGGTFLSEEIEWLHRYQIARIYSPDDGRRLGIDTMIIEVLQLCDFPTPFDIDFKQSLSFKKAFDSRKIARAITQIELHYLPSSSHKHLSQPSIPIIGITGTGGAGKSSVTDELIRHITHSFPHKKIAIISIDPSKKKTGGALLGDRIRMNHLPHPYVYMRSLATRNEDQAISAVIQEVIGLCVEFDFDMVFIETAGIGQADTSIVSYCSISMYVMTPEYGSPSQLEKINMLDYADIVCVNKFDKVGALDALYDIKKQYMRNHPQMATIDLPIVGTCAHHFNDQGIYRLFQLLSSCLSIKHTWSISDHVIFGISSNDALLPIGSAHYLNHIVDTVRTYNQYVEKQSAMASTYYQIEGLKKITHDKKILDIYEQYKKDNPLDPSCALLLLNWDKLCDRYNQHALFYEVRNKKVEIPLTFSTLSHNRIKKISLPTYKDWGDILRWQLQENVSGRFPFTAGVFETKRLDELPTRMFAGEGTPEQTNKRFHLVSKGQLAKRLSTAFDSITLYGEDPQERQDIFGKIGNSGVSIATIDDCKKLYSGFDLCDEKTSVSMTINGPAPIMLAFFLHTAIDQLCEKKIKELGWEYKVAIAYKEKYGMQFMSPIYASPLPEGHQGLGLLLLGLSGADVLPVDMYQSIKAEALKRVRGTVQADILKEDQAQNTCIFSLEFALQLMGDVQSYFITHQIKNFYSVSVSGYHIAEAGANPITQLAFTLANGFTYIEYYLSRGMQLDDFLPNFSFFFSNGMDVEYSVLGRVARRIWAKVIRDKYHGNERSQKLKYHIQTSGRSLHAQEINFNDMRTCLQALYAIYDHCNSLHTNAYDEAITTPTEESVRRALAIQYIIQQELGTAKIENVLQGSFAIEELTNIVELAVLKEFTNMANRGGVLGCMERMYQRNKIQEESLYYETQKSSGILPIIGVNTFLKSANMDIKKEHIPVTRSTEEDKRQQIKNVIEFKNRHASFAPSLLEELRQTVIRKENVFNALMHIVPHCSLGQIVQVLYDIGGKYRRNM